MAAGVASGLQNRFGVRTASRVGSIPTRSRRESAACEPAGRQLARCRRSVGFLAFLLVAFPTGSLRGQETDPPGRADSLAASEAPLEASAAEQLTSPVRQEAPADSAGPTPPVSPTGAFFRSLILPGWGQISVDQPGRGAFYFAMEAGSLWMLLKTNAKLNAAKRSNPLDEDLIAAREAQFEDWATLAVFWALFAGVDAWVSAQLWDFTGELVPPPDGSPGAAFQYSIPVGP